MNPRLVKRERQDGATVTQPESHGEEVKSAQYPHHEITQKIIAAAFEVHQKLGWGFLEKVYENALAHELEKAGLKVEQQNPIPGSI